MKYGIEPLRSDELRVAITIQRSPVKVRLLALQVSRMWNNTGNYKIRGGFATGRLKHTRLVRAVTLWRVLGIRTPLRSSF